MLNKKVLIVDDQEMIRKLVKMTLTSHNFDIFEAKNGTDALEQVNAIHPDIIILDIMMPGTMNGLDVCKSIRRNHHFDNMIILMLTAKTQESDQKVGMVAGATDYLIKPFSPEHLLEKINHYLNKSL